MRNEMKPTVTIKFTRREADWLVSLLIATANKAKSDAEKAETENSKAGDYAILHMAKSLKDRIESEGY